MGACGYRRVDDPGIVLGQRLHAQCLQFGQGAAPGRVARVDHRAVGQDDAAARQVAIGPGARVSTLVADALIDTGNETAVARLVANEGAELTEEALGRVLTDYTGSEAVAESISRRPTLPPAISEHLVSAMAKKLKSYLASKHDLPPDAAANLILQKR